MKHNTKSTLLLVAAVLFLGACSSKPVKKPLGGDIFSRQVVLAELDHWQLHARIGLRSKDRSGSATLIWEETRGQRRLRLIGPLGGGLVQLQQDENGVTITDGKGRVWQSEDAGELIYRVTGWQIPVSGLRWWLLGLVEPGGKADSTFDTSQRLSTLQQDGWNVTLAKYRLYENFELPSSIVVESAFGQEHERYLRAKLIVKDWKFDITETK